MLRSTLPIAARVYGSVATVFSPGSRVGGHATGPTHSHISNNNNSNNTSSPAALSGHSSNPKSTTTQTRKQRQGGLFAIANDVKQDEKKLRQQLNLLLAEERDPFLATRTPYGGAAAAAHGREGVPQRRLVQLPGVERRRDLPADPITRLFFQHQGDHALYYGSYEAPSPLDQDRLQLEKREPRDWTYNVSTPVYDFCHRLREASEQRKRFVVVPSTLETRGCAKVLLDHGIVAGFRDFHNDRAFAVELKYFQSEPTIHVIEPCSYDGKTEFEWSPKMMRRFMNSHGVHNRLVVYVCRTADNRVIDHIQAVKENIGGRGLLMVH